MRRTLLLLLSAAVALLLASGAVLALPSEKPDNTPMDGRVRAIEHIGTNIWLGGRFSRVEQRNGTLLGRVANVAVFDSKTNKSRTSDLSLAARTQWCGT